jgi:hypothetical protein
VSFDLFRKYKTRLKLLARDKHASLFDRSVSDEGEKRFYGLDTRTVIIDILNGGDDQGVGLESGGVQDGDVEEVALRQGQAAENDQVSGVLLNLERAGENREL